jgi:3-isopropylmalate/(R)-2-methylmalate dehydratase small subunit
VCPAAVEAIENGESVEVDLAEGKIVTAKGTFAFPPFPPAVQAILSAGGLIPYLQSV